METNKIQEKEINQIMEIDGSMMSILNETRKWTKFLAILGFIGIGFMLLIGLFTGAISSTIDDPNIASAMPFPAAFIGIIYISMAVIYFFPVLYLLNFSNKMKKALYFSNHEALYEAFKYLKYHYKFIGIITIISLLIGGAFIVGMGIFTALSM